MSDRMGGGDGNLESRLAELEAENTRLKALLGLDRTDRSGPPTINEPTLFGPDAPACPADESSPLERKVALFRSLFAGRDDVFALRWDNPRTEKSGWGPAVRGGWSNARKPGRQYLPLTDRVVEQHLAGDIHAGLYPLLRGDACRILACDFDGAGWVLDALAYVDAAHEAGVPVALERSRSGDGGRVWTFFAEAVPAATTRAIGIALLREAMATRAELDLTTYDRLFPAQDFLPKGSFGNLIALPLNGSAAAAGRTVFLDLATLEPHADQWAFLSSLPRLSREVVSSLARSLRSVEAGPEANPFHRPRGARSDVRPPEAIRAELHSMVSIERTGVPPSLLSALKHLASLHNPEFYERERLRLSTWRTPRFIRCYSETLDRLLLPRGLLERARSVVVEAGSSLTIDDRRPCLAEVRFDLTTTLGDQQRAAVDAIEKQGFGVVVAPPGTGKTVIACGVIARLRQPTLVIVDRKPLLDQWRERLTSHLGLERKQVGLLGSKRFTCAIDLVMAQSLARREDVAEITSKYGLVVVDECHHVPAVTFERCVRQIPVRAWLGLTATPYRRDGLQALITMHCGPVAHEIRALDAEAPLLRRQLIVHSTNHARPDSDELRIQEVFRGLVEDESRNHQIADDITSAVARGRNCLVLTQWTEHLDMLCDAVRDRGCEPLVLKGGMGRKARDAVLERLNPATPSSGTLLVASGSYLGEGFDCPALDTLFLAFPLAFKGRVVQYVGRILRTGDGKADVEVHDYVDVNIAVLSRMHAKRLPVYSSLGFDVPVRARGAARRRRT